SSENANAVLHDAAGPLVSLSEVSGTPVTVDFSTADGTASAGSDYGAVSGRLTFGPGDTSKRILVSIVDDGVNEPGEAFTVNLSHGSGASIGQGQGVVSILNTQTKFFVVDDGPTDPNGGPTDRIFKYESSGASIVSNVLDFGDTGPVGVCSNAAGTLVWVVDA